MNNRIQKKLKLSQNKEIEILKDIYRLKILTAEQIRRVHFPNAKQYHYRKMHSLYREGLIDKGPYVENGKKEATIYWVTNKGIRYLDEQNAIVGTKRQAKDNKPQSIFNKYYVYGNELYAELTPFAYEVIDSRVWKKKYNLYTNTLVKAGLRSPNGHLYGVYQFFEERISDDRMKRLIKELQKYTQSDSILIFVNNPDDYKRVEQEIMKNIDRFPATSISVLRQGFGIDLLKYFNDHSIMEDMIHQKVKQHMANTHQVTNERLLPIGQVEHDRGKRFADYIYQWRDTQGNKYEHYIVNHLTANHRVISHLNTHYTDLYYETMGLPVLIITWTPHLAVLQSHFYSSEYITTIGINPRVIKQFDSK